MPLPLGSLQKTEQFLNAIRREVAVSEFIPQACHFDNHTLLTKNGELMQTIKIMGFGFEPRDEDTIDLRQAIRQAIFDHIHSNAYAVWFHTIRRKKNLDPGGKFPDNVSRDIHKAWCKANDWEHQFTNEIYITIVREGQSASLSDIKNFFRPLLPWNEMKYRNHFLDAAHKELDALVCAVVEDMKDYGGKRLGIVEEDGVFYSEPMKFLGKLVNLAETPYPLPMADISAALPTHKTSFGFNALEVRGETGAHYGTVITFKEYHEIPTSALDEFLQLPEEFIITECLDFISRNKALHPYRRQKYIADLSGDSQLAELSGLTDLFNGDTHSPTDYTEHQFTLLLLEDDLDDLEASVVRTYEALNDLGIMAVREDIFQEHCYWSQLPGNFPFITRAQPVNTSRAGGFASLYNFPAGKAVNNLWGSAVTVFRTLMDTPYFFNFHFEGAGHTALVGPRHEATLMLNFLMSETQKFSPRTYVFDQTGSARKLIEACGGVYTAAGTELPASTHRLIGISCGGDMTSQHLAHGFEQISRHLDDKPCIVALEGIDRLIRDTALAEKFFQWLDYLQTRNAMVVATFTGADGLARSRFSGQMRRFRTVITHPEDVLSEVYIKSLGFEAHEIDLLGMLERGEGHYLIRHGPDSVPVQLSSEAFGPLAEVLAP